MLLCVKMKEEYEEIKLNEPGRPKMRKAEVLASAKDIAAIYMKQISILQLVSHRLTVI